MGGCSANLVILSKFQENLVILSEKWFCTENLMIFASGSAAGAKKNNIERSLGDFSSQKSCFPAPAVSKSTQHFLIESRVNIAQFHHCSFEFNNSCSSSFEFL